MSEVKSALQRLGDLAHIPNDALERLSRKRARTQRNRRIGAALLAFMVAGAGIGLGLAAFIGSSHPRPSRPAVPRSAIAIWPQQTLRQVSVAQRLAEAGDPDYVWQLDPGAVIARFARQRLGWPRVFLSVAAAERHGPRRTFGAATCKDSECYSGKARRAGAAVTVEQLGRRGRGGVWVVTVVRDAYLELNVEPGGVVPEGSPLIGFARAKDGAMVTGGFVHIGSCKDPMQTVPLVVRAQRIDFEAGPLRCDAGGYVFLVRPGRKAIPFGAGPVTAGSFLNFTAIPVRFVSASEGPPVLSPPYVILPRGPEGHPNKRGVDSLRVRTTLPDGTKVIYETFSKDVDGLDCCLTVKGGVLNLRIAPCDEKGRGPPADIRVQLTIAPVLYTGASCPMGVDFGCGRLPQPPPVLAALGRHFELASGDQVRHQGRDTWIVATRDYRFTADTCVDTSGSH